MQNFKTAMQQYIAKEISVLNALNLEEINDAIHAILDTCNRGGVIYTMGNGGSAATASHIVCDLAKGASEMGSGKNFLVECLCDNTPMIMAIANDISYEEIFSFQLNKKLHPEDLVLAISGSGNSKNIIKAVEYAKQIGTPVLGITGYSGGKLKELADYRIHVDIDDMQITEDIHMIFDHMMLRILGGIH